MCRGYHHISSTRMSTTEYYLQCLRSLHNLQCLQCLRSLRSLPNLPNLPNLPSLPSLLSLPNLHNLPWPQDLRGLRRLLSLLSLRPHLSLPLTARIERRRGLRGFHPLLRCPGPQSSDTQARTIPTPARQKCTDRLSRRSIHPFVVIHRKKRKLTIFILKVCASSKTRMNEDSTPVPKGDSQLGNVADEVPSWAFYTEGTEREDILNSHCS